MHDPILLLYIYKAHNSILHKINTLKRSYPTILTFDSISRSYIVILSEDRILRSYLLNHSLGSRPSSPWSHPTISYFDLTIRFLLNISQYDLFLGSCRTIHRIYIKGVKRAEYECKNRFTNERWNCPELFVQLQNSLHESTNPTNTIFMSRKYFL